LQKKLKGDVVENLQRKEAYRLLMDLIGMNLAIPSMATLKEKNHGNFDLF